MTTHNLGNEEKAISRIILMGSTFVILVVVAIIGYLFFSAALEEFRTHLRTFESKLIQREESHIRTLAQNLVGEIREAKKRSREETGRLVRRQSMILFDLIRSIREQNGYLDRERILERVIDTLRAIRTDGSYDLFLFDTTGTLLYSSRESGGMGMNFLDFEDMEGRRFVREIVEKGGFVEYRWFVPKQSAVSDKITYSIRDDALGIVVGSGAFLSGEVPMETILREKIRRKKLNDNELLFACRIDTLNAIAGHAKLIAARNVRERRGILEAVERIMLQSDYRGGVFYRDGSRMIYGVYLPRERLFVGAGVRLGFIDRSVEEERKAARETLHRKMVLIGLSILGVALVFFILSYFISKRIERIFRDYRVRVADSQQMLVQQSKMAAMGEMIGHIAHQWRQPLSQLSGLFHDIESAQEYGELDRRYLRARVDEANDLLEYMSETIDEFRNFFTPDRGAGSFRLGEGVAKALRVAEPSLRHHGIEVAVTLEADPEIRGSLNEFSQVLLNLLGNAKEAAIARGIERPRIVIGSRQAGERVTLSVTDNCGGIDEAILERIFDPYVTSKYGYGTGIGLYMARMIVENRMGGEIRVANVEGGAQFLLIFGAL